MSRMRTENSFPRALYSPASETVPWLTRMDPVGVEIFEIDSELQPDKNIIGT